MHTWGLGEGTTERAVSGRVGGDKLGCFLPLY